MIKQYNITDYIKDDPELQKAVIKEFLNDIKRLQAENERLKANFNNNSLCNKIQIYEADEARMRKALEEIREMVNEPCVPSENDCLTCPTSCFTKDILIKINEVLR